MIIFDHLGIQFETHRGFPSIPLIVSRRFIPATTLRDFVINEGLRRWDVRYYLAAMTKSDSIGITLEVAYEVRVPEYGRRSSASPHGALRTFYLDFPFYWKCIAVFRLHFSTRSTRSGRRTTHCGKVEYSNMCIASTSETLGRD